MAFSSRVVWFIALLSAARTVFCYQNFVQDDALVSFRYARNLLERGELVWNPGEWVEGYTNFGHLILVAGLSSLTGADLIVAARMLGFVCLAVLLLTCWRAGNQWMGLAVLVGSPALWVRALAGMECVLVAGCLVGATAALVERRSTLAGLLLACGVLCRPDAVVWALAVTLAVGFLRDRPGDVLRVAAPWIMTLVLHTALRWYLYGALVPNTAAVKVGIPWVLRTGAGIQYLVSFLVANPLLLFLPIFVGLAWEAGQLPRRHLILFGIPALVQFAYVVVAGGEQMSQHRFLLPVLVSSFILLSFASSNLWLMVGIAAQIVWQQSRLHSDMYDPPEAVGRIVGEHVAEHWSEHWLIALHTAGSTPYYAPHHRFLDMLGLTDAHIAHRAVPPTEHPYQHVPGHAKGDGAYVLSREPDAIILGPAQGWPLGRPLCLSDVELAALPDFSRDYVMHVDEIRHNDARIASPLVLTWYERR